MSRPAHILYVGAVLPKRSETFVYREVLGLRDRGVRVSVASVNPPERDLGDTRLDALSGEAMHVYGDGVRGKLGVYLDAARMRVWRPTRGLFETPPTYWPKYMLQCEAGYALARRVRNHGITHVHAHMAHVPATVAMHCAEALGVPFSFTGHAADLFRDRSALKTKLQRAAFVACISHWHRGFYNELVPRDNRDYPVIRCGVDVDAFQPGRPNPEGGLLAVGRLVRKKGFDLLIEAVARTANNASLTIVGDGPEQTALQRQIDELGLAERVRLAGAKSNDAVRTLMREAKAFVLPCRVSEDGDRDGIPVVLMEAMASGLPVVSGDLPTIRELVEHERTGLMVAPGDVRGLTQAICRLWDDEALCFRLAEAGRQRVIMEFSSAVNLSRLSAAFEAAAVNNGPAVPAGGRVAGAMKG